MIEIIGTAVGSLGLGFLLGWKFRRARKIIARVLIEGQYTVIRNDGTKLYNGDDHREAKKVYSTTELRRGESVDFYDNSKWRGRRTE